MLYMNRPPAPQTAQFQNSILYTLRSQEQEDALYAPVAAMSEKKKKTEEEEGGHSKKQEQQQLKTMGDIDPELLKKLPPMPKEWSVGDPIPGLDTAAKEQAAAEVNLEKKPSVDIQPTHKAKEAEKQTKKPASGFAFALNPDLDADIEFGVDSDEEGSSSSSDDDF